MKKIIMLILATAVIFAAGLTGYAQYGKIKAEKELEVTEEKAESAVTKAFKNKDMKKILKNNGLYEDEIKRNMTDYLRCVVEYNMPEDVNNILISGAEKGKDLDKLIKIYQFLFMADKDFSKMDKMYEYGERSNFKNTYWLEEAYNYATDNIGGVLNEEEITAYLEKGLTYEDISIANSLCFKGTKTINEILDERLNKKDWADIISSIYPKSYLNKNQFKDADPYKIMECVRISEAYGENINEMYDKKTKKLSEKAENKDVKKREILNKKIKDNDAHFVMDDSMMAYAKAKIPELAEEEIKILMEDGYLIREIERGIKLSKDKGISIKEAIDKDFKGGKNR